MDTAIITTLATSAGTVIATVALVSRIIGSLRSDMDRKINGLRGELQSDIGGLRRDMDKKFNGLRGELQSDIGGLRREIGGLRSHMDQRLDSLVHANQQAHDAIGHRIDAQGTELRAAIDAQGTELRAAIDAQGTELRAAIDGLEGRLARTAEDVAFIKGRLTGQAEDER